MEREQSPNLERKAPDQAAIGRERSLVPAREVRGDPDQDEIHLVAELGGIRD